MSSPLAFSLPDLARALRRREVSAAELTEEAIARHEARGGRLAAYKSFDGGEARRQAAEADARIASGKDVPPLCGIPLSVKDLYGVRGFPTYAGTRRRMGPAWEDDGWLVGALRSQAAVFTGKTHTVEMAYGGVGINPNWETPWNPWDRDRHRIPGGSSAGAGVSLHEGSAVVALGTDTGGSIRIPAAMTGVVGHRPSLGRWSTAGIVPLSSTLDAPGALTRTVEDSAWFFGAVDSAWGDAEAFLRHASGTRLSSIRIGVPSCGIWRECRPDIADALEGALDELGSAGILRTSADGTLLDRGAALYMEGVISGPECRAFLAQAIPDWEEFLHPVVATRLAATRQFTEHDYRRALADREALAAGAAALFADADVLALPTTLATPPLVSDLQDLQAYGEANARALRPTCAAAILGLCALTLPVGLDASGMPVGLQLLAPPGADERLLAVAWAAERALGTGPERLGPPPAIASPSTEIP